MLRPTRRSQRGFSLAEVMMATAMIGVLVYATVTITSTGLRLSKGNMDRQFATQKAISMLEELKALVQINQGAQITVLDGFEDGTAFRNRLTTVGNLVDPPDEPVSGNIQAGTGWFYSRQISVRPLTDPNNPNQVIGSTDVRLVRVRVYKNDPTGREAPRLLAEVASVVRTLAVSFPPTEVFDVYCVAAENVPGWWVNMSALVPTVQNAINDLQSRHPGLQFRQHWITKLSFGRDMQYKPYINGTVPAAQNGANTPAIQPFVYFYPGTFPDNYVPEAGGSAVVSPAQDYYSTSRMNATMLSDDTAPYSILNPFDATQNPVPYALADMYNNSMRYFQELDLWNRRSTATIAGGELAYPTEAAEPTLRLLIDDMFANPTNYTNALVINLHGELMPFPPIRNYSDAAKKPDVYNNNGVRVVTHPEQLTYGNGTAVNLRVYSYLTNPPKADGTMPQINYVVGGINNPLPVGREYLTEPITVVLRGANWDPAAAPNCQAPGTGTNANSNCVAALSGGVDFDTTTTGRSGPNCTGGAACTTGTFSERDPYTSVFPAPASDAVIGSHRMYYTRSYIPATAGGTGDTVIQLFNSPLVSPCVPLPNDCTMNQLSTVAGSGGIEHRVDGWMSRRLYGQEYVPSPMENFAQGTAMVPFARDLDYPGAVTKNTARWVLSIPASVFNNNSVLQVETYIGNYTPDASAGLILGRPTSGAFNPVYTEPPNQSMTFVWRGDDNWLYGTANSPPALPLTERFQFTGDPRHCPYADVKMPHTTNGGAWPNSNVNTSIGMGYNRYFDDFEDDGPNGEVYNETVAWEAGQVGKQTAATVSVPSHGKFSIQVDGIGTTRTTDINNTAVAVNRTLAQIRDTLNGTATFNQYAVADLVPPCNGACGTLVQYLRIRSQSTGATSAILFDTAVANNVANLLGFTSVPALPSWSGWNYTAGGMTYGVRNDGTVGNAGWRTSNGAFEIDVPRAFQCFRSSLMRTNAIYTSMTGFSYYYLGIGNEIGYDAANGWPDNVPVSRRPFEGTDNPQYFEQTILPNPNGGGAGDPQFGAVTANSARCGVKYIQDYTSNWWGMNWIGELYPDSQYKLVNNRDWRTRGNLAAPDPTAGQNPLTANTYRRVRRDPNPINAAAGTHLVVNDATNPTRTLGTTLIQSIRRTREQGIGTFFWASPAATVVVFFDSSQGTLAAGGTEVQTNYNYPLDNPILANRGFKLGQTAPANDSLTATLQTMYGNPYNTLSHQWSLGLFYSADASSEIASELIAVRQGATANIAYVVENGLSPSGNAGTDEIGHWAFMSLVQSFFDAGRFNNGAAPAVEQVPRVMITDPNPNTNTTNPTSLNIAWSLTWLRWDGKKYTTAYPANFAPSPSPNMTYFVSYSANNGLTWQYIQAPALQAADGVRPDRDPVTHTIDTAEPHRVTTTSCTWTGIATLPAGAYTIRVEGYRDSFPLHYSYHQYQIFINR